IVGNCIATLQNASGDSNGNIALQSDPGFPATIVFTGTQSTTYNGVISNIFSSGPDAGVIKQGSGSLTFTNNGSVYAGGTQFNGGTLAITVANNGTTSGPLGVPTSGTLSFNGGTLE